MGRDVPFKPNKKCDVCGKPGAFDFMGDYICADCMQIQEREAAYDGRKDSNPGREHE